MPSRTRAPTTSTSNLESRQALFPEYVSLQKLYNEYQSIRQRPQHPLPATNYTAPSQERLNSSLTDQPYDINTVTQLATNLDEKRTTVLYLAYGSNLCDETFLGNRGIKPISTMNVQVPELRLTFDLPGIPYNEPCFANTARRDPTESVENDVEELRADTADYHKDRWKKGLVGVVYEVSLKDYAHIIATEGGGASYHDIVVTCYPLPTSPSVPKSPTTPPFKAHTLFAPAQPDSKQASAVTRDDGRFYRPDPSYAQPSARYLKLMTDGTVERGLPGEYLEYLLDIRPYTITTKKQHVGQFVFLKLWMPILQFMFGLAAKYQDDKGRTPDWLVHVFALVFNTMWLTYDGFFKPVFGDGERTQKSDDEHDGSRPRWWPKRGEKQTSGYEQC